jgi:hypothetical protein
MILARGEQTETKQTSSRRTVITYLGRASRSLEDTEVMQPDSLIGNLYEVDRIGLGSFKSQSAQVHTKRE